MTQLAARYTIVRELGRGRGGVVHEAQDEELGQRIAIKVIDPSQLADPGTADRLRRELAAAHRVTHPGVCRVFDTDVGAGLCTMELLDGEPLERRLAQGPISRELAIEIMAQLERALAAIHAAGVVHGELHPRNIMLCGERVVLLGLGDTAGGTASSDHEALRSLARTLGVARPRRRAWVSAIAAALVVGAVGAAVLLWPRSSAPHGRMATYATGPIARWLELDGPGKEMIDGSAQDADGNVYVCGHLTRGSRLAGRPLVNPFGGALAGLVASYDRDGRPRWHRVISAPSRVSISSVSVDRDLVVVSGRFDGGVIELGRGQRLVATDDVGIVLALSASDGGIRWGRTIKGESVYLKVNGIAADGSIVVAGEERTRRVFAVSYDREGNVRWTKTAAETHEGRAHALAFRDDNVIVVGEVIVGETVHVIDRQSFVAALALATGELRWKRQLTEWSAIARDVSDRGPLVIAGEHKVEHRWAASVMELDPLTGEIRWQRPVGIGVTLEIRTIATLADERIVIAGELAPGSELDGRRYDDLGGPADLFVALVPRDGPIAVRTFGGPGRERIRTSHVTSDGRLAIAGHHQGIAFDGIAERGDGNNDGFYAELRLDQLFAPTSSSR